jgi:hypothetical protein
VRKDQNVVVFHLEGSHVCAKPIKLVYFVEPDFVGVMG